MFLREIAIHADERIVDRFPGGFVKRFHRETCGVTEVFNSLLKKKLIGPNSPKICMTFSDLINEAPSSLTPLRILWPFDFSRYVVADDRTKAELVASALLSVLMWIGGKVNWPLEVIQDTWDQAKLQSFRYCGTWGKSWTSPTKHWKASVEIQMDVSGVDLAIVVTTRAKREVVRRFQIDKLLCYDGCLMNYISLGEWVSDSEFRLESSAFPPKEWRVAIDQRCGGKGGRNRKSASCLPG